MKTIRRLILAVLVLGQLTCLCRAQVADQPEPVKKTLRFPGVVADLENRSVDIEAEVCLNAGLLEFIACTKNTKEHESIVVVHARPMHIHTALLAIGVKNGNPGMSRRVEGDPPRWEEVPPSGGKVSLSLVIEGIGGDPMEFPISDFIKHSDLGGDKQEDNIHRDDDDPGARAFPNTFLFAGSRLYEDEQGQSQYMADVSGDVISISTFGDEVLCLPGFQSQDNANLSWEINPEMLPKVGTKVILRLRPQKSVKDDRLPDGPNSPRDE
ncbi:MAG: hypothetical protein GC164_05565 [Phycisphaera sp.]|nr:hypothetical protein [Phycisphaera sp.]